MTSDADVVRLRGQKIVDVLEAVLAEARAGRLVSVAVCAEQTDGGGLDAYAWSEGHVAHRLVGLLHMRAHRVADRAWRGAEIGDGG